VTIFDALLLAVVQGLTEFLPVSSSGHLVLAQHFLHITNPGILTFDVYVHLGTLISLLLIFWSDVVQMTKGVWQALAHGRIGEAYRSDDSVRMAIGVLVASVPAGVIGVAFHKQVEEAFTDPKMVAVNLVITGLILFLTRLARPLEGRKIGFWSALAVGLAQAVAILPGISRSGSTISTGMYIRLSPVQATRFSFLMAIPVIAGAVLLETRNLFKAGGQIPLLPTIVGTAAAALVGYIAIKLLLGIVRRGKFSWFAFYCLAVGIFGIVFV